MFHDVTIFLKKKVQQDILTEIILTHDNQALCHRNISEKVARYIAETHF